MEGEQEITGRIRQKIKAGAIDLEWKRYRDLNRVVSLGFRGLEGHREWQEVQNAE